MSCWCEAVHHKCVDCTAVSKWKTLNRETRIKLLALQKMTENINIKIKEQRTAYCQLHNWCYIRDLCISDIPHGA